MTPLPDSPSMTVAEVATALKIGKDTAYAAIHRGDIPSIRIGKTIRIPTIKIAEMLGISDK